MVISSGAAGIALAGPARADSAQAGMVGTLYVDELSSTCSDSGSGTQALPFCTLQQAASVAQPGDTILVSSANFTPVNQSVTFTQSGTPSQPITVTWSGAGWQPAFAGSGTGTAVFTFSHVHDVNVSGLRVDSGTADGADVVGSQDIVLDRMRFELVTPTSASGTGVSVDGSSSAVTVSRTLLGVVGVNGTGNGIRVLPGAAGITITTNYLYQDEGTSISVAGASGVDVTSNTVIGACGDVAVGGASSAVIENNVFELSSSFPCTSASAAAVSVDATSAPSVTTDYNLFDSLPAGSDYSWAGAPYSDVPTFSKDTGQGAHDTMATSAGIPAGESSAIDSADCGAPGELTTDTNGKPHVDDPLVPNTGVGTCYADRGAHELQDTLYAIMPTLSPVVSGVPTGATPVDSTVTIASPATSSFGYPVTYMVDFGDGSAPVQAAASASGLVATHQYTAPGLYTVTITATDTNGTTKEAGAGQFYALSAQPVQGTLSATPGTLNSSSIVPDEAGYSTTFGSDGWQVANATLSYGDGTPAASPTSYSGNGDLGWSSHVFAKPGTYTATLTVTDRAGRVATTKTAVTVGDLVRAVGPARDAAVALAAHATLRLTSAQLHIIAGHDRAAFVTITVTGSKSAGYVTVYPDGTSRPGQAAVEFGAGRQASDLALATFGRSGYADFYNGSASPISVVINTVGAEGTTTAAETYTPVTPASALPATKLAGNQYLAFTVAGKYGVPGSATAVVVDITASGGTATGHFITYPERTPGTLQQGAYWSKGQQATGLAVVPVNGRVGLKNVGSGTATFTAQVVGYYSANGSSGTGSVFLPSPRARVLYVSVGARHSVKLQVTGKNGIPATGTTAVSVNVTATGASAPGTVTAYADGTARPALTSLSYVTGSTAVNAAIVAVGTDGAIDLYNNGIQPVTVVVDLTGSYYAYPS